MNNDININQISEALNDKADRDLFNITPPPDNNIKRWVVEVYKGANGSWYEVYNDGWLRQGGMITGQGPATTSTITVTYLKPYINHNYCIQLSGNTQDTSTNTLGVQYAHSYYGALFGRYTTHFDCRTGQYGTWTTEGQGA